MHTKTKKQGFVLITAIGVTGIAMLLVYHLFYVGSTYVPFLDTVVERQQAQMVAQGGIALARQQLAQPRQEQEPKKKGEKESPGELLLQEILPTLNRWQFLECDKKVDGIEGSLQICLMAEEGKLNINALYDFKAHAFVDAGKPTDRKKVMQLVFQALQPLVGGKDLLPALEQFLQKRKNALYDVTELLTIKEFAAFKDKVFYVPPTENNKTNDKAPVYLTDLFTTFSSSGSIEPWLLSDSVCAIYGFARARYGDDEQREKIVEKALQQWQDKRNWATDWQKVLMPLYKKEFMKESDSVLTSTFEPKVFSVLSYGKVGRTKQKLFAILERVPAEESAAFMYNVHIKKLYWI